MVDEYNNSPILYTVLATAVTPFETYDELGALMADAQRDATGSDIVLQNYGGVRYEKHPAGDFTMKDALSLDPFGNELMVYNLTGDEIAQLIRSTFDIKEDPFVSGIQYECQKGNIKVMLPNGKPLDPKKTYTVGINSYLASVTPFLKGKKATKTGISATDALIDYLKKQQKVDYKGVKRSAVVN
jgi:2',3'-cyclic-nucleotide 2'-phosphodiesterase (5'-nucleotidase family)